MLRSGVIKTALVLLISICLLSCQTKDQSVVEQGKAYLDSGNYKKATDSFNEAIRLNPNNAKAYYFLGHAYSRMGQYQEALEPIRKAVLLSPDWSEALYSLAGIYIRIDQYLDAIDPLKQAINHSPEMIEAYLVLGIVYTQLGQYQKAVETYKQAIAAKPDFALVHRNLGRIYLILKNEEGAIEEYNVLKSMNLRLAEGLFFQINKNVQLSDVDLVKNSTMPGYNTTTIGKVFDASFDSPHWSSFESKKGERIVEFTGKISEDLHNEYIGRTQRLGVVTFDRNYSDHELWEIGSPVEIDWVILPDGKSVRLKEMASTSWEGLQINRVLDIIYNK